MCSTRTPSSFDYKDSYSATSQLFLQVQSFLDLFQLRLLLAFIFMPALSWRVATLKIDGSLLPSHSIITLYLCALPHQQ